MEKTIIVGLGGTGCDTIRALRRLVVENYGVLDPPELRQLGYLYVDTDSKEVERTDDNRRRWESMGVPIGLGDNEYVMIEVNELGSIIRNIDSFPHIKNWFPIDALRSIDASAKDTPGARQIRALGRIAFALRHQDIERAFKSTFNRLPQAAAGGRTQVYLVTSISGGTGSGMFLDMAYSIREWTNDSCDLTGVMVLPELTSNRGDRYLVNAYAALKELNYYSVGYGYHGETQVPIRFKLPGREDEKGFDRTPFDNSYLVSPTNRSNVELALEALPGMVAHRIFLNFDSSFADAAKSLLNNGSFERTQTLEDPFYRNRHSQNFFCFGLSSIQYPVEHITELCGYRLARDYLTDWLTDRAVPGDIHARVTAALPAWLLSDDFLNADRDIFGKKNYDNFSVTIEQEANNITQAATPMERNLVPFIQQRQQGFEDSFRQVGITKYYQGKVDDLKGASAIVLDAIRANVAQWLTDPTLGRGYARQMLLEARKVLEAKHQELSTQFEGYAGKETNGRAGLEKALGELREAEDKLLFKESAKKEALQKSNNMLRAYFAARIGRRATEHAVLLLNAVLAGVAELCDRLDAWQQQVIRLRDDLNSEVLRLDAGFKDKTQNLKEFNGQLLLSDAQVDAVYNSLDRQAAGKAIERGVLDKLKADVLDLPFLPRDRSIDVTRELYYAAIKWLSVDSSVRVSETNVADRLCEESKTDIERAKVIGEAFRKSAPFLVFDKVQMEVGKGTTAAYKQAATTSAVKIGLCDDKDGKLVNVTRVRKELATATGAEKAAIETISDPQQILFLQEETAFPLRLVKDLKALREKYDRYNADAGSIPVHLAKSYDPVLMELFLPEDADINEYRRGEEGWVLARIAGRTREEENRREGRVEVRYRYRDAGADTYTDLGPDWEAARAQAFAFDPLSAKLRQLLWADAQRELQALDTRVKRSEMWAKLRAYLDQVKADDKDALGEESAPYKRELEVVKRLNVAWKLEEAGQSTPVATAPSVTSATIAAGSAGAVPDDVLAKFTEVTRTALRNSKGELPPVIAKVLEGMRVRSGISVEVANSVVESVRAEFGEPRAWSDYRDMLAAFLLDGVITDDERAQLLELQATLGLADGVVQRLERDADAAQKPPSADGSSTPSTPA